MYNNKRLGQHLAKSSAWSLGGQIVSTTTTMLFFVILSRTLPPADVGTYMLIMHVVMVGSIIGTFGVQTTMIRKIAADLGTDRFIEVGRTAITGISLVAGLSMLIGILLGGPLGTTLFDEVFHITTNQTLMTLIACWLTLNCCHIVANECLRGFHDIKYATIYGASVKNTILIILI